MRKLIVIVGKIVAALLLLVVVLIPLVLYMGNAGIPFVEGTCCLLYTSDAADE